MPEPLSEKALIELRRWADHIPAAADMYSPPEIARAETVLALIRDHAHQTQEVERLHARVEQLEADLAVCEDTSREVVAEVAVQLSEQADWQGIADWCGGQFADLCTPSGERELLIVLPDGEVAHEHQWITLDHDGVFRVRDGVRAPSNEDEASGGLVAPICPECGALGDWSAEPSLPPARHVTPTVEGARRRESQRGEDDA